MKTSKNKNTTQTEAPTTSESQPRSNSRRDLLKSAGLVGAALAGSAASTQVVAADQGENEAVKSSQIPLLEALETLTAEEARTLEVICDLIVPSDKNGPGAKEARAVHYIDRSLAAHNSGARHSYMASLSAINDHSRKRHNKPYAELNIAHQLSILHALQGNKIDGLVPSASGFFNMVRSHTIDGTFCDPYYGGNQNFVGWDMIKYPGVRLGTTTADVAKGSDLPANHQSAYNNRIYTKNGQGR